MHLLSETERIPIVDDEEGRGTQFDPWLLDLFFGTFDDVLASGAQQRTARR